MTNNFESKEPSKDIKKYAEKVQKAEKSLGLKMSQILARESEKLPVDKTASVESESTGTDIVNGALQNLIEKKMLPEKVGKHFISLEKKRKITEAYNDNNN